MICTERYHMNKYRVELVGSHGERIFMGGERLELSEWARRMKAHEEGDQRTSTSDVADRASMKRGFREEKKHRIEQPMKTKMNIGYLLGGIAIGFVSGFFIAVRY